MKLSVNKNSKIYVLCPAAFATGGPEVLHQLVYNLNRLGFNAFMVYFPLNHPSPVHNEYKIYGNPYVRHIEDNKENILIVPEVRTDFLYKYENIQKVIWWLSVNNYYSSLNIKSSTTYMRYMIKKILKFCGQYKHFEFLEDKNEYIHFYQSEYAKYHLLDRGVDYSLIYSLSDYLNKEFLEYASKVDMTQKEDIIVYNPKKGIEFTRKVIKAMGGDNKFKFIPVINMTRKEVINLLSRAKIYIDFGTHPGKDRIPREAVSLYCCILTSKLGSAKFYKDVPIDDAYKFDNSDESIDKIKLKINEILKNFTYHLDNFEFYRKVITYEEQQFINDIKKIFVSDV